MGLTVNASGKEGLIDLSFSNTPSTMANVEVVPFFSTDINTERLPLTCTMLVCGALPSWTLLVGVESGLVMGVIVSLALFLLRASRPHIAIVGLVPGTEHFRNVLRHDVRVSPKLVCLRVDASMFFANARGIEDRINAEVATRPELQHVLLQCSAVNDIDASALESLEAIASRLKDSGIALHFSEIKGPVMDKLSTTAFLQHLNGQVFLTNYQAIQALTPDIIQAL
jgi:SulP family sulfate permease